MATSLTQILNWVELCNKLGGSSSSKITPNKGEIASNWGSTVYLDSLLPSDNKVLPNNGQVWPIKVLKYSTGSNASLDNAYTSQSTGSFNFRNTSWDSGYTYDYTSGKLYNQGSTVAAGYYMENDASNTWYHTNSRGTITESGTYIPKGFSFIDLNANIELGTSYNNTATHRCRSSETSTAIISQTAYNLDGTSSTTGNYVNASINNACTVVTFTRRSGGYDSSKPMVVVRYGFSSGGDLNTISDIILIHPPWSISSADITGVSSSGETVTPVVNTNMGDYTLSSNKSWAVVSGTSINVAAQSSSGTTSRSATITVRARLNDSWGDIEYDSGNVDTTFTLTQNAYVNPYSITLDSSDWEYVSGDSDTFTLGITTTGAGWEVSSYSSTYFSISPTYNNSTGTTYATIRALRRGRVGDSRDIIFRSRGDSSKTATFTVWYLE